MADEDTAENAGQPPSTGTPSPSPVGELHEDEIVTRLVRSGAPPAGLIVLFGYLGKTAEEGRWRLYRNLALSEWVEFLQDDLLHHQQFPPPGGGTRVWLKPNALIAQGRSSGAEQQAAFLRGDIAANTPTQLSPRPGPEPPSGPDTIYDPECSRSMAACFDS